MKYLILSFLVLYCFSCAQVTANKSGGTLESVELSRNSEIPAAAGEAESIHGDDQLNPSVATAPMEGERDPYNSKQRLSRSIKTIGPKTLIMQINADFEKALAIVGMLKYWESRGQKSFFILVEEGESSFFLNQILKLYVQKGSANLVEWVLFKKFKNKFPLNDDQLINDMAMQLESEFSLNLEEDPFQGDCQELQTYIPVTKKAICLDSTTNNKEISVAVATLPIVFPKNYRNDFALADYLSFGKKHAKELMGKLK
jgi:hypothetical protein